MSENSRIPMQYFMFEVNRIDSDEASVLPFEDDLQEKAFVSCWIKDQKPEIANMIASGILGQMGWEIVNIEEHHPVEESDYPEGDEMGEFYAQALMEEELFLFHPYEH